MTALPLHAAASPVSAVLSPHAGALHAAAPAARIAAPMTAASPATAVVAAIPTSISTDSTLVKTVASALDAIYPTGHNTLIAVIILCAVFIAITSLLAHLITKLIRRIVGRVDDSAPVAIFVNIGRVLVWCLGASIILSECFGIDPAGIVTALGVGGIALSLGLQDTIKNLIGGLQLSTMRLLSRGDHVRIGSTEGIVGDVTWRHTTVKGFSGETTIMPNSVLNSASLTILPPVRKVKVPFLIPYETLALFGARGMDAAKVAELAAARATERLRAPAPEGMGLALQSDAMTIMLSTSEEALAAQIVVWIAEDAEFDKVEVESAIAGAVADVCAAGAGAGEGDASCAAEDPSLKSAAFPQNSKL